MSSLNPHATAIITGAGSERGIGRATARRLAADRWSLGLIDLDGDAAEKVAAELRREFGVTARGVAADVTSVKGVETAVDQLESELPAVEALVNAAGISSPMPFMETTL